ncbi:glycosyltransferase [Haloferula sp.]|uniref:glycosyltransferase n=1 Tax=Haloferula sp. TaxID=2497595 RepID=UPI0032A09331
MSDSDPKIAVVFASFNRREVALECVRRLRSQTRLPEMVVVGDNASEDGSAEALRDTGWSAVEVIDTGGNHGNAGAVQRAMDHAFSQGADAVWILDDDSWPRADALEAMVGEGFDPEVVIHPLQEDPKTGRFTWPLQVVGGDGTVTHVDCAESLPEGSRIRSRGVWTGAMISRRIRDAVGPVNAELFIRGEDEEYPWRIEQAGFKTLAVPAAVMDHPGPEDLVSWSFLGKSLFLERGLSDWKLHYKVRNMVWLKRQQKGSVAAFVMALAYAGGIVRTEGLKRLPVWWRAVVDGWRGRLGRKDFT